MANRYATKTGNWSDTAVWDGGTLPGAGDVVRPNSYTVTIDQDITVGELRNDASSPAVAGGTFSATAARVITCALTKTAIGVDLVALSGSGAYVVNGAVSNASGNNCIAYTGTGSLTVNGPVSMTGNGCLYFNPSSAADLTINGDVTNSYVGSSGCYPLEIRSNARLVTVNGTVRGASTSYSNYAIYCTYSSPMLVINGAVYGRYGGAVYAGCACIVNGPVYGGSAVSVPAVYASNTTTVADGAILTGGVANPAVGSLLAGKIILRAVTLRAESGKVFPVTGVAVVADGSLGPTIEMLDSATPIPATYTLSRLGSTNPAPANVRAGTTYGTDGLVTGTLAVPNPGSVAYGVPTDATTGTAVLDLSTVAALVGQQIAAATSS